MEFWNGMFFSIMLSKLQKRFRRELIQSSRKVDAVLRGDA